MLPTSVSMESSDSLTKPSTSKRGTIYTFYSYKGGVGRSMALANVAELLYQLGLRVLLIDWDLEAPGLERYFEVDTGAVLQRRGLIDLLLSYKDQMTRDLPKPGPGGELPFETPDRYLVNLHDEPSALGRLWLLPAGKRAGDNESLGTYGKRVREFNWKDFYDNWEGELYFEWFRQQLEQMADVILIDSRTGATEIGNITTYQLADVVLVFCATNEQSQEGALQMAESFRRDIVEKLRGGRPLKTIVIPSRVPDRDETTQLTEFRNEFLSKFRPFVPEHLKTDPDYLWSLKIPYFPIYSFKETVAVREKKETRLPEMVEAYANIVRMMARLQSNEGKSEDAIYRATRHLPSVIKTGVPVLASQADEGAMTGEGTLEQDAGRLPWELDVPTLPSKPECPYPGMVPFDSEQAQHFYGRTAEVRQMVQHLRSRNLLLLIGPSGCGKTSLVHAGLVPALTRSSAWPSNFWRVLAMRPGDHPISTLEQILESDLGDLRSAVAASLDPRRPSSKVRQSTVDSKRPKDGVFAARRRKPATRLLLIIDQFEELFKQAVFREQIRFYAILRELTALEECALVIVVRADAYSRLDQLVADSVRSNYPMLVDPSGETELQKGSEGLIESIALSSVSAKDTIVIAPLRGTELREAIQEPASSIGVKLDAALVERLISDAGDEPGRLPLVQGTLVSLWDHLERQELTLRDYEILSQDSMSALQATIVRKADTVFATLSKRQQLIAQRIFLRLVQFGEGRPDTRRQQPTVALRIANEDEEQFEDTLAILVDHWLVISNGGSESKADRTLDLAHEALVTSWPRLRNWIASHREAEQTRRRFDERAIEWISSSNPETKLLNSGELDEVESWLESPGAEDLGIGKQLLELRAASHKAIRRYRLRGIYASLVVAALGASILSLGYFGWLPWLAPEDFARVVLPFGLGFLSSSLYFLAITILGLILNILRKMRARMEDERQ